jgi:hypothetical protein
MQSEFFIHTDQKSLVHLNEQRLHTPWQQKVFYKLLGLRYKVVYRHGVDNGVADALSRRQHQECLLAVSSMSTLGYLPCKLGILPILKLLINCLSWL